jgi:hypothetical protein
MFMLMCVPGVYTGVGGRRAAPSSSALDSDCGLSDSESMTAAGYMSDGDVLHMTGGGGAGTGSGAGGRLGTSNTGPGADIASGYMSESGVSQYAKRLQQRFTEGMLAVRECMTKGDIITDDDRLVR